MASRLPRLPMPPRPISTSGSIGTTRAVGSIGRLAGRWVRKGAPSQPLDPERAHCIVASPPSRAVYAALRSQTSTWPQVEAHLGALFPHAVFLLEDLFHALYQEEAPLNPDVDPEFHWNFRTVATLLQCPEWGRVHHHTQGDPLSAALLARQLAEELAAEAAASLAQGKGLRRAWQRFARGVALPLPFPVPGEPDAAAADKDQLHRLSKMLRQAAAQMAEDEALRRGWSICPGSRCLHDFDDVAQLLEMARSLSWLAELMDALERFQSILPAARPKARPRGPGFARIVGYRLGHDLNTMAPEEAVKLTDRHLEGLFYEAYEHRRLLQHAYTGSNDDGHGPVVCCMDVSRSMNQPAALGRARFVWTKAIGLAVMDWARRSQRPFMGVCFSSEHELQTFVAPPKPDPRTALAMAQCDFDGGTKFEPPLQRAVDFFEEQGRRQGHLIFITDGEAPLSRRFTERFRAAKARLGIKLQTVFIDGDHEPLTALSDGVYYLQAERIESWEDAMRSIGRCLVGADRSFPGALPYGSAASSRPIQRQ